MAAKSHNKYSGEDREGSNQVIGKEPCPKCNSSDNLARYLDGHGHCFTPGCGHHEAAKGSDGSAAGGHSSRTQEAPDVTGDATPYLEPSRPDAFADIASRKLKEKTLRNYGYFRSHWRGKDGSEVGAQVAPYYDQQGKLAGQKIRLPNKDFPTILRKGVTTVDCQLFGQKFYGERFDRKVVVTEGEIDAMSIAQVVDFKFPSVSVSTGAAGAKRSMQNNYRWLDRFEEIILWFDDDEAGTIAAEQCAKLFKVGKVRIARAPGFKDASEALQANKPGDIEAALYAAVTWRPAGIVNPADCFADIEEMTDGIPAWEWPWAPLQDITKGIRLAEVTYLVSGTGMGKTTVLHQTAIKLLSQDNNPKIPAVANLGIMCFEDTRADVQMGLLSVYLKQRLILRPMSKDELRAAHTKLFSSRRIEMFDPETAEWDFEAILSYIRFMAKGLGCNVIFIDPLSFIAAGLEGTTDERRALDKVAQSFAKIAKELNIALIITHHLTRPEGEAGHEEGAEIILKQLRGSGGPANFSSTIIGLEGDQQGTEQQRRRFRVLKNRRIGTTGVAGFVDYDPMLAIMVETSEDIPKRGGKGKDWKQSGGPLGEY